MRLKSIPGLLCASKRLFWSRRLNVLNLAWALAMFWPLCSWAAVPTQENPYRHIYERNLFALRPPMVVQKAQPQPPTPSNVILTGITTVLGEKRAFLEITVPAKPPLP